MSFYDELDSLMEQLPQCEIIVDDETVAEPERCNNKVFGICSTCNKSVCYYHSEYKHREDTK